MKPHLWFIRFIGLIVPRRLRANWRQEWEAELSHREELLEEWDRLDRGSKLDLLWRSTSSFWDALWLQPKRLEDEMFQDIRFGLRMLLKNPGFTLITVFILALGIGANTAVFTLINSILLRPLPVANPHELVAIEARNGGDQGYISFPIYRDLRTRQEVFTDILVKGGEGSFRLTIPNEVGSTEIDNVSVSSVSANYWNVLGVRPEIGRFFTEDEDRNPNSSETAGSVVVLSYSFWERQFGRDPGVPGRTVLLRRSVCKVIGVAPQGFFGDSVGSEPDLWIPIIPFTTPRMLEIRTGAFTSGHLARLKPGVSREQAQTAMTQLFQQLVQAEQTQAPPGNPNNVPSIKDLTLQLESGATGFRYHHLHRTYTRPLWIIMAIVALVLLIACANVANLLLARAASRQHEISVRLAVGCGRFRLVRQLLTESLMLSALGTAAGLLVAWWGSHVLLRLIDTGTVPLRLDLSPDMRVFIFTATAMVLTGIGFGLVPALRASRVNLASAMKDQARGTGRRGRQSLGRTLIVFQVALSLLLLVGAGLLIRSLYNLRQIDLGFRPEHTLIFDLVHNPRNSEPTALARVAREVHERVRQIPGVQSASVSQLILFGPSDISTDLNIHDYQPQPGEKVKAHFNSISPGYFETVGMTMNAGRGIEERDRENAPLVVVINEALARRYFPAGKAVGRIMQINDEPIVGRPAEIVGVVRDAKYNNLRVDVRPMIYLSVQQFPGRLRSLEVRTSEPIALLTASIRGALSEVTKDLMIRRVETLRSQVDRTLAGERLITMLCTFFGVVALLLASIGIYGVLSYEISERTQEIGIRMALGATGRDVLWMVLRQSLPIVFTGIAMGLPLALGSTRLISGFLYQLSPTDPAAITLSVLLLILVALVACYLPARRATKLDPLTALRHE